MRNPHSFCIEPELVPSLVKRARRQEAVYGHNTAHFSLEVEKENTVTGVLGEFAVVRYLSTAFQDIPGIQVDFTEIGAFVDVEVTHNGLSAGVHVKCGLWKSWPADYYEFGVHADQGIQGGEAPIVLVTLLHPDGDGLRLGRVEGFLPASNLQECRVIKKGERFPSTGVRSRTENIVTTFGSYFAIDQLPRFLLKQIKY